MFPCLFNLIMQDLGDMLSTGDKVTVGDQTLNSFFYTDDVVLISESEVGLLNLLQTANSFAKMWGMQFSEKKSQILITGKWISNKQWQIVELNLAEITHISI